MASVLLSKAVGWGIFLSICLSITNGFTAVIPKFISGILFTGAALILFPQLARLQQIQVSILVTTGMVLVFLSGGNTIVLLEKALTINNSLITLIISVGFLKLLIHSTFSSKVLPKGNVSLWKTLMSLQLFGALLGLSAIVIYGDKLKKNNTLTDDQVIVLTRTFGGVALWAPFLASLAAAMILSKSASYSLLLVVGFSLSMAGMMITGFHCMKRLNASREVFEGFPMQWSTLLLPISLSVLVLLARLYFNNIPTLTLVSVVILVTVVITLIFQNSVHSAFKKLRLYIETSVSKSGGELSLFLSAGILAVGISAFLNAINFEIPISQFVGIHAVILLMISVFLSLLGLHPVISVSVFGGLLSSIPADPDLLGLALLFSWGVGVIINPLSGISLLMQSRYNIATSKLIKINLVYTVIMMMLASGVLYAYDAL